MMKPCPVIRANGTGDSNRRGSPRRLHFPGRCRTTSGEPGTGTRRYQDGVSGMLLEISKVLFWLSFFILAYTYVGYGLLVFLLIRIKRLVSGVPSPPALETLPDVTLIVAAHDEERCIEDKVRNSLALEYPKGQIRFFFVTDGSDDHTPELVAGFPVPEGVTLRLYHQPERRGKTDAIERIMRLVETPVVIFTDANTHVNPEAVLNIVRHYNDPEVGAVAGEKRIALGDKGDAAGAGEGLYWKYESTLKRWDSELYSTMGGAGELFSIRTELYEPVPGDSIIQDFIMTMRIAQRGYRIAYEPEAWAAEGQSASIREELKRKIRNAAGGLQAISRLRPLLNPFKYGTLSFQFISHRVLRWTAAPLSLPVLLMTSAIPAANGLGLYQTALSLQLTFYGFAFLGYLFEERKLRWKVFFVPYYFCVMNYAVFRGFFRFLCGRQSVVWERARRA